MYKLQLVASWQAKKAAYICRLEVYGISSVQWSENQVRITTPQNTTLEYKC